MAYCNVTTDLTDVFPDIERYQEKFILEGFVAVSGQANTYAVYGCGQINMVFDNDVQLTEKTSIATVQANAGSWWYDSDNDVVYVHATDSDDLTSTAQSTTLITSGEDWDTLKDNMRDKSMQFMDSVLNSRYTTPLMPRLIKTHDTADYEYPIVRCCALLTCAFLAKRRTPTDPNGERLFKEAWNPDPEPGEQKGWLNQLRDGDMVLQEQISGREIGGFNIYPKSDNTATAYVWFLGKYTGAQYERWRLQIDTAGAIGTATWKLSRDGGTNWDLETQDTFDTTDNSRRILIYAGIYAVFYGTFGEGDYWDIEVFPMSDSATVSKIGSIELER
ncbi:hypothetical protein AMJ80_03525 [bacterium SM23_31]|nr:MAG: hypothetical protein AMJ80_03525 [bacterium SM23_31]